MKISRIEIKDVNQFRDLDIDLTYPKGHAKAGQPLEKVCIIGQSGTGKTTLLKFIYGLSYGGDTLKNYDVEDRIFITRKLNNIISRNTIDFNGVIQFDSPDYRERKQLFNNTTGKIKVLSMYFPADRQLENIQISKNDSNSNERTYDFSQDKMANIWDIILSNVQLHQEKELALNQRITNIVSEINFNDSDLRDALNELNQIKNSSPLIDIAEKCLNPILKNFNLAVKTELDIKTKDDIGFIKIIDGLDREVPYALLSTGTKQILLSALPLYVLQPSQTIILYDEPERSLYPDMQKLIVDYYTSFTKDSQFFFATHSPIIASCFEPWEIVELKFDSEGFVVQEQYYEGERHVDNYTINPKYLTYDLMLSKVFDIEEPYNEERTKKITEFLSLKGRLDFLKTKNETETKEYKDTFKDYLKSGKELSWEINTNKVA